jgi:parallel beta-helix repeat protein
LLLDRAGWAVAGALAVAGIALLAGVVRAGPLDPPGAPSPTGKTLDQVEPRTPITSIPAVINEPGSYYLTGDMTLSGGSYGIYIAADNVTVDLGGFTLDGGDSGSIGVYVETAGGGHNGIVIRNGTASHWAFDGFGASGTSESFVILENVNATYNSIGISGYRVTLSGCAVSHNSAAGISVIQSTVADCTASMNQQGIAVYQSTAERIEADQSVTDGIQASSSTVRHCSSAINGGNGITATNSIIESCIVNNNHYGIVADDNSTVRDNAVTVSYSDGIRVVGTAGKSVISGNTLQQNALTMAGSGIYVESSGNRITHNAVGETKNAGPGIQVVGNDNVIDENSALGNLGIGIIVHGSKNTVVRNSSLGNAGGTNYDIGAGNNAGPIDAAAASTNPWSNTQ